MSRSPAGHTFPAAGVSAVRSYRFAAFAAFLYRSTLLLALSLILLPHPACGESLEESRRELEEIRQRIRQTSRTLAEKEAAEKAARKDLARVEKTLLAIERRTAALNARLAALDLQMTGLKGEIGRTGTKIDDLDATVRQRIVALYKGGEETLALPFFSPLPVPAQNEERLYWQRIVAHDRSLLGSYRQQLSSQQSDLQQLSRLRQEQSSLRAEVEKERAEMARAAKVKEELLSRVRKDQAGLSRELASLKERAGRVDALVRELERTRTQQPAAPGTDFAGNRGRLPWPVSGRVRIPYGKSKHPDLGTPYQSNGIEIEATGAQPIRAVWPGRVAFANSFKGYGNMVILDHGDGYYTLYAQAARLESKVGDRVKAGQIVGRTEEAPARLYFEVRKGGTPLNPGDWLQ